MKTKNIFFKQLQREALNLWRQPRLILHATLFFIMFSVFFPLTLPASVLLLREVSPGLLWMAVLLFFLLASERLFQQDFEDGITEQWLSSGHYLPLLVFAKLAMHWLACILPLLLFCPFLALIFSFSYTELLVLILSFILATPALFCLSALAAAFSTAIAQKGIFMALILLPLSLPILIFATATLSLNQDMHLILAYLALLLAFSILSLSFLPFAIAAVLRISLSA